MKHYDIIIIGSGIAGISLGSILSKERKVAIIEKEKQLSYHSTGRSFAFFIESYGNNAIIELTKISKNSKPRIQLLIELTQKDLFYQVHIF